MQKLMVALIPVLFLCCQCNKKISQNQTNPVTLKSGGSENNSCNYRKIQGSVKIISIKKVETEEPEMFNNPMTVRVQFSAENAKEKKNYAFKNFPDEFNLTIGSGYNPPLECLGSQGIKEMSVLKASRSEIISGTCTPVIFKIDNFIEEPCFQRENMRPE